MGRRLSAAPSAALSSAMIARQRVCSCVGLSSNSVAWPSSRRRCHRLASHASHARIAGWLPVGEAERALVQIEPVVQRSRSALVGGQDGPAALQRLMNLPGQRVRIVHTPFIRLPDAENVVGDARLLSHQQVDAGRVLAAIETPPEA